MSIDFRSDVSVDLVESVASDSLVARSARVSTGLDMDTSDYEGLIGFLIKNRHGSPFEHGMFLFRVEAPIFVWREHMRHRIASYNEESGRYKELDPVFYVPDGDRPLLQRGKPGQYDFVHGTVQDKYQTLSIIKQSSETSYMLYKRLLGQGIAREVARMVLPLNIYSSAYVSINPRSLMNFLSLRTKSDESTYPSFPQREIEMVAERYEEFFSKAMPITYDAFVRGGRVAP